MKNVPATTAGTHRTRNSLLLNLAASDPSPREPSDNSSSPAKVVEVSGEALPSSGVARCDEVQNMIAKLQEVLLHELALMKAQLATLHKEQTNGTTLKVQKSSSFAASTAPLSKRASLAQLTTAGSMIYDSKTNQPQSMIHVPSMPMVPEASSETQLSPLMASSPRMSPRDSCKAVDRFLSGRRRLHKDELEEELEAVEQMDAVDAEIIASVRRSSPGRASPGGRPLLPELTVSEVRVADLSPRFLVSSRVGPRLMTARQTPVPSMHGEAAFDQCDEQMSLLDSTLRRHIAEMGYRARLIRFLTGRHFEHAVGLLLVLNAVVLGIETDVEAREAFGHYSAGDIAWTLGVFEFIESLFCIVFTAEVCLRLGTYRCSFFTMDDRLWNIFDFTICTFWVTEQVTGLFHHVAGLSLNPSVLRMLRLLRVIRITRLIRIVRSVEQLRTIVSSILASMKTLIWTLTLLAMMIYMVSVLFTQVVLVSEARHRHEDLIYWFSSLPRTCLTMFEVIAGGVSWDSVIAPVVEHVSPSMGVVFVFYVAFSVFAMTNIITGIFVESAMSKASEDKDQYTANHIRDLFFNDSEVEVDQVVTWDTFHRKMDSPDMRDYFRAINVDPSEAKGLFRLIDTDASGSVDAEELVNGCLRLRGGAKALDLSLLMYETSLVHESLLLQSAKIDALLSEFRPTQASISESSVAE